MIFPGVTYGPDLIDSSMGGGTKRVEDKDIVAFTAKPSALWIYIYGRIEYMDVFKKKHTTSYCAVSNGANSFGGCPEGVYPTYAN